MQAAKFPAADASTIEVPVPGPPLFCPADSITGLYPAVRATSVRPPRQFTVADPAGRLNVTDVTPPAWFSGSRYQRSRCPAVPPGTDLASRQSGDGGVNGARVGAHTTAVIIVAAAVAAAGVPAVVSATLPVPVHCGPAWTRVNRA